MFFFMIIGSRLAAIAIIGQEVLNPRGLSGLAVDTLEYSPPQLLELLMRLAQVDTYPALIHCTQGKDRTGLLVLLVLLLCEVPLSAIKADYLASERELESEREERVKEMNSLGIGEDFAGCDTHFVETISSWLEERGGIRSWLESIGGSGIAGGVRGAMLVED